MPDGPPAPVVCLVGPTGAGKTAAAVELARALGGAVVNLDSRQIYQGLEIVTAQPTLAERRGVEHLLYGFLPPRQAMSAGRFAELARTALAELQGRGLVPILVGGTGLYLDSLLGGLADIPETPAAIRDKWQRLCAERGPEALHAELQAQDPAYAARIHPRDRQRITRALEVLDSTGQTFSQWHADAAQEQAILPALKLAVDLPREELLARLAARIEAMLAAGALEEMRQAYANCPDESAPGFTGIGCPELLQHLLGRLDLEAAKALWFKRTKDYAKRQLTWFRKDPAIQWFRPDDVAGMLAAARQALG